MKQFNSDTFTQNRMHEMCDVVRPNSVLDFHFGESESRRARSDLERLIGEGYLNEISHLQQGINSISYEEDRVIINEVPFQYHDSRLLAAIDAGKEDSSLIGPTIAVFAHVFQNDVYIAQVRGKRIDAPGKIQIVAGGGEYGIYPADNALKEAKEEVGIRNPNLILDRAKFLDISPFMKSGRFPQPIFSYIISGDINHISTFVRNAAELERFETSLHADELEEAYPFAVPIENLHSFVDEVDKLEKFYGPVKRSIHSFLEWYNKNFEKNY